VYDDSSRAFVLLARVGVTFEELAPKITGLWTWLEGFSRALDQLLPQEDPTPVMLAGLE
jgi:hypothetical protein